MATRINQLTKQDIRKLLADPQALNSYGYARNNPLRHVDLDGQFWSPFNSVNAQWFINLGDWANNTAQNNKTFDYVTSHPGVAYVVGGVGAAAGLAAGAIAGAAALGVTGAQTLAGACVAACDKVSQTANEASEAAATLAQTTQGTLQVGQSFGKLGTVIENESGQINDLTDHAVTRFFERTDMSLESIVKTVNNPLVRLQQAGNNTAYLSKDAFVVLNQNGKVVTWYGSQNFGSDIKAILSLVK